jgi:hypothetical protein
MNALTEHSALQHKREIFAPMTDDDRLAVHLRHLLSLDPTAVYNIVGDSTVVYYISDKMKYEAGKACTRIVLAPNGKHRRIGAVGFDPRTKVPSMAQKEKRP